MIFALVVDAQLQFNISRGADYGVPFQKVTIFHLEKLI